jgi:hypothetical protein
VACDVQRNSPALVRHTLLMRAGFAPAAVEIAGYFVHQLRSDNDPAHLASAGRDVGGQSRNRLSADRPAGAHAGVHDVGELAHRFSSNSLAHMWARREAPTHDRRRPRRCGMQLLLRFLGRGLLNLLRLRLLRLRLRLRLLRLRLRLLLLRLLLLLQAGERRKLTAWQRPREAQADSSSGLLRHSSTERPVMRTT